MNSEPSFKPGDRVVSKTVSKQSGVIFGNEDHYEVITDDGGFIFWISKSWEHEPVQEHDWCRFERVNGKDLNVEEGWIFQVLSEGIGGQEFWRSTDATKFADHSLFYKDNCIKIDRRYTVPPLMDETPMPEPTIDPLEAKIRAKMCASEKQAEIAKDMLVKYEEIQAWVNQ